MTELFGYRCSLHQGRRYYLYFGPQHDEVCIKYRKNFKEALKSFNEEDYIYAAKFFPEFYDLEDLKKFYNILIKTKPTISIF